MWLNPLGGNNKDLVNVLQVVSLSSIQSGSSLFIYAAWRILEYRGGGSFTDSPASFFLEKKKVDFVEILINWCGNAFKV